MQNLSQFGPVVHSGEGLGMKRGHSIFYYESTCTLPMKRNCEVLRCAVLPDICYGKRGNIPENVEPFEVYE